MLFLRSKSDFLASILLFLIGSRQFLVGILLFLIRKSDFLASISLFLIGNCQFLVRILLFLIRKSDFLASILLFLIGNCQFLVGILLFLIRKSDFLNVQLKTAHRPKKGGTPTFFGLDVFSTPLVAGGGLATKKSVVISSSSFFKGAPGAAIEVYEDESGESRICFGIKNPTTGQLEQVGYFDSNGFHGKVAQ